jgi:hypothetical protein
MGRRLLVIALALLLAAQVIRNAAVSAFADTKAATAAQIWRDHPAVELSLGMTAIGDAAHRGRPVSPAVFKMIEEAAAKAPLAPEPFLVRGVQAELSGHADQARLAFLAAEWRDPHSLPARYFLADQFFRAGDVRQGLKELAVLARLAPNGNLSVAPYVASYAKNPANWPKLRALFRYDRNLEEPALNALAADPANAAAVLALADPRRRNAHSPWLATLLTGLVNAGQYVRARAIWAEVSGVHLDPGGLLYDSGFADADAPPPFNWALTSSTVGLAERQPGGRLHVIYYGQEDGELARQMLLLPPGSYRLSLRLSGDRSQARALSWSLTCDRSEKPFTAVGVDSAAARGWVFSVPAGCPAQYLRLIGGSSDIPHQADVTLSGVSIAREPANG